MIGPSARLLTGGCSQQPDWAQTERTNLYMVISRWQGTDDEFARLRQAVARNCMCVGSMLGLAPQTCSVHHLLNDQSALDRLLFVYRLRRVFITREFYAFPSLSQGEGETR
jgi:hypothetical protein